MSQFKIGDFVESISIDYAGRVDETDSLGCYVASDLDVRYLFDCQLRLVNDLDKVLEASKPLEAPGGIKHDQGKPTLALLSPVAINKIGLVMNYGATKYADHNWRKGISWSRLLSACLRHTFAYIGGEDKDPETGISHLAHAACCLMFLLEFEETHPELDNRFKLPRKGA
jgi:hypothetical protein